MLQEERTQKLPATVRRRYPRRTAQIAVALIATAVAVLASVGVFREQLYDHRGGIAVVAGFLVVNVLATVAGDALERGGERYATERTFLGLRLRRPSNPARKRSNDR